MTLLIKQGRFYRRRDEKIAGPMPAPDNIGDFQDPFSELWYSPKGILYASPAGIMPEDLLTELEEPSFPESVEKQELADFSNMSLEELQVADAIIIDLALGEAIERELTARYGGKVSAYDRAHARMAA